MLSKIRSIEIWERNQSFWSINIFTSDSVKIKYLLTYMAFTV